MANTYLKALASVHRQKVRLEANLRFQRKFDLQTAEETIVRDAAKEFKTTETLEQKLNDYRKIQDRNDYNCVSACSSFLSKAIAHLEEAAGLTRSDILDYLKEADNFNLEQMMEHFTRYSKKK